MAKLIVFTCQKCGKSYEEIFSDTEEIPEGLKDPCESCGGSVSLGCNFKNNCQSWKWNDGGGS